MAAGHARMLPNDAFIRIAGPFSWQSGNQGWGNLWASGIKGFRTVSIQTFRIVRIYTFQTDDIKTFS